MKKPGLIATELLKYKYIYNISDNPDTGTKRKLCFLEAQPFYMQSIIDIGLNFRVLHYKGGKYNEDLTGDITICFRPASTTQYPTDLDITANNANMTGLASALITGVAFITNWFDSGKTFPKLLALMSLYHDQVSFDENGTKSGTIEYTSIDCRYYKIKMESVII